MPSTISPMAIKPPPTAPPMIAPLFEECAVGTAEVCVAEAAPVIVRVVVGEIEMVEEVEGVGVTKTVDGVAVAVAIPGDQFNNPAESVLCKTK